MQINDALPKCIAADKVLSALRKVRPPFSRVRSGPQPASFQTSVCRSFACVCVRVRACVCMRACVRARARVFQCVCLRV